MTSDRLKARARLFKLIRAFFDDRGMTEVDTAQMVPSPGLDVHLDAFGVTGTKAPKWLITSPEYQMKQLLAEGSGSIYQLVHCFRRDELGAIHSPEFMMLEWYEVGRTSFEVMQTTQSLVHHVFESFGQSSLGSSPSWQRLSLRDAFRNYANINMDSLLHDETQFFRILIDQIEPKLGFEGPVFLTGYPASMASLARLDPDDPTVADRFEAYINGIELCNGFGELTDPKEQRRRLEHDQSERRLSGKEIYPIDEAFLGALERGLPACSGNALGVDRLLMLALGLDRINP